MFGDLLTMTVHVDPYAKISCYRPINKLDNFAILKKSLDNFYRKKRTNPGKRGRLVTQVHPFLSLQVDVNNQFATVRDNEGEKRLFFLRGASKGLLMTTQLFLSIS